MFLAPRWLALLHPSSKITNSFSLSWLCMSRCNNEFLFSHSIPTAICFSLSTVLCKGTAQPSHPILPLPLQLIKTPPGGSHRYLILLSHINTFNHPARFLGDRVELIATVAKGFEVSLLFRLKPFLAGRFEENSNLLCCSQDGERRTTWWCATEDAKVCRTILSTRYRCRWIC